ncbi:hypothetical protein FSP39_019896 [Pinctada imbricata]|uniref:Amine oxidase domain-containing protein n=1 Tax=Pinctada imbricata TaxID=66713 RepID=A0AA89BNZ1_PINIB|nr:hypothetical protein FSP39_019896 [Pinctada imbricata]
MELGRELVRYMKLHKRLFGDYDGFLMARPNARVRRAIRGTISDFLRRNKMPLIETAVIYGLYTGGGYGQPHKVSSIYGLMWITPKVCRYLLDDTVPVFTFFDTGLISLFETLIRRFAIDVKLNVDIRRIRRDDSKSFGNIQIEFSNRNNPMSTMVKEYDFLIISPAMRYLLDIIDVSPIEKKIFRRQLTDTFFMSTLVDSPFGVRSAYPFDVHRKRLIRYDFEPYVGIDVFSVSKNYSGESYKLGLTPGGKDGRRIQSTVYYQVGRDDPRIQEVGRYAEEKLHKHLREKHRIPYSLIARFITPYFTRFSVPDMDKGIIWDVFDLQGHRKTWYIGGSVTFDTAGAVIEYNEKILRNYRLPPKRFEFDYTL